MMISRHLGIDQEFQKQNSTTIKAPEQLKLSLDKPISRSKWEQVRSRSSEQYQVYQRRRWEEEASHSGEHTDDLT